MTRCQSRAPRLIEEPLDNIEDTLDNTLDDTIYSPDMPHILQGLHSKIDSYLQPPSVSLPPLRLLATHSPAGIVGALTALRELYWPAWFADEDAVACTSKSRRPDLPVSELHAALPLLDTPLRTDTLGIPDSGYASAEEEAEDVREVGADDKALQQQEEEEEERIEVLRADPFERAYAVRWLTGLIARGDEWGASDMEYAHVIEEAAALLARCADTHADGALARRFVFGNVTVELWDEPYADDPAGVGLQTWGSACVLAARLCADPSTLGLDDQKGRVRVLELGAGTGLLSLAVAARCAHAEVVATDFHPGVLANLRGNVARNAAAREVRVEALDWEHSLPVNDAERYDVILAADVIYDARHGGWIKRCAEGLLRHGTGTMWMIVPRRPTRGREVAGVEDVFAEGTEGLKILHVEDVERRRGVGRADEPGYKLFRIGW